MILVFDLDDTIVDTDGYSEKYISRFIKENNLPYKLVNKVARFAEKKFNWDMETALRWYKEYGDDMMLEFPCREKAKEVLDELYEAGHKIIIATARANDWHKDPEGVTKKWLEKNNIRYHKLYVGRVDKEKICEEEHADVFLDDDVNITKRVAEYFKSVGNGKSCLFVTDYNSTLDVSEDVIRIKSFVDFYEMINKK